MRFDKVRLSQLKEYEDDWIAIGFKFGIGFCAAATIFAIIGTLLVNAWFAYQDRNVWYSYSSRQQLYAQMAPSGQAGASQSPVPAAPGGPAEHDALVPSGQAPEDSQAVAPAGAAAGGRVRPVR